MADKIVIELTEEVAINFIDGDTENIDFDHLPFNKFIVAFPTKVILPFQQILLDTETKVGRKIDPVKDHKAIKAMREYIEANLLIKYEHDEKKTKVEVYDNINSLLFSASWMNYLPLPIIEKNDIAKEGIVLGMTLIRIMSRVVNYMNSPTVVKTREIDRVKNPSKKQQRKGKSKSNKTYVYKTVYKMSQIDPNLNENHVSRHYTRQTESWAVKGYWRHYKNPDGTLRKKVFIESHTRGKGKTKDKQYKITRTE